MKQYGYMQNADAFAFDWGARCRCYTKSLFYFKYRLQFKNDKPYLLSFILYPDHSSGTMPLGICSGKGVNVVDEAPQLIL